jgi:toxin-antitoxin system PIN domain toxin
MKHLCDSNVWLAIAVEQHAHHKLAAAWFESLGKTDFALFCRATRISFLRILTQKIAPDFLPLGNREAWLALDRLTSDEATGFAVEPEGLDHVWRQLSELATASPKRWMDAYLAAFAIAAGMRLVTFDSDFLNFKSHGLDLILLAP